MMIMVTVAALAAGARRPATMASAVVTSGTVARTTARPAVRMPVALVTHEPNDSAKPVLRETARAVRVTR
jgi:hypothetical protein